MPQYQFSDTLLRLIAQASTLSAESRHEFVMAEHLLAVSLEFAPLQRALADVGADYRALRRELSHFLDTEVEKVPQGVAISPSFSVQLEALLSEMFRQVACSSATEADLPHFIHALFLIPDIVASQMLAAHTGGQQAELLSSLVWQCEGKPQTDMPPEDGVTETDGEGGEEADESWLNYVTVLTREAHPPHKLIGRQQELERMEEAFYCFRKNNVLLLGDHGVGKTALVCELAERIRQGKVASQLARSSVFQIELTGVVAGTQYRGDFEKRLKMVMEGIARQPAPIVFIDDIHTLVGAGQIGESSMDASTLLKPWLDNPDMRFVGCTTHELFSRHLQKNRALARCFQQIDVEQPSPDICREILRANRSAYEQHHRLAYTDEALDFIVTASEQHLHERRQPEKALELMDRAGAYVAMRGERAANQPARSQTAADQPTVTPDDVSVALARMCKVDALAVRQDDNERLQTLETRMKSQIFGQDEAVSQVVEAIQMAKAGLLDDGKPLGALLFVGPTGVGKTEVARVLARELSVELVRFDMSEYTERHAVAKLIGSPAGYVGYEDGGLLTDAIRKTPNCVLLLDEIEKAHPDIYNILLQVMDYARLTDNKGRKADFRNAILIMTSNAGAQHAAQANIGFRGGVSAGEAMMRQVKKTFKPEFVNRLSGTVVFRDMDRPMARRILDKKLRQLADKLRQKQVDMRLTDEAHAWLLDQGFTREYGAREMDRVIARHLKPLLMRQMLFGGLRGGGTATIALADNQLSLT